ncbi:MAG: hypothetical protein KDJ47_16985 [Hyphomicrobiaceae bacterium]|nr:hypothetical protein [Hyphomicrobiaceae bacterium]
MGVVGFEKTCSQCHRDQIIGKARASGPKGIAFLALPGIDLETLRAKRIDVGEWPEASEASLTPFMKVMVSRTARGRQLIEHADRLTLQDLSAANGEDLSVVASLVWEIKELFYQLIEGRASEALGDLTIGNGAKPDVVLAADLTAGLPRDVIVGAQQEWLPNLATEIAHRRNPNLAEAGSRGPTAQEPGRPAAPPPDTVPTVAQSDGGGKTAGAEREVSDGAPEDSKEAAEQAGPSEGASDGTGEAPPVTEPKVDTVRTNPQDCVLSLFGACVITKSNGSASVENDAVRNPPAFNGRSNLMRLGAGESAQPVAPHGSTEKIGSASALPTKGSTRYAEARQVPAGTGRKSDDLLSPTAEELRAIKAHAEAAGTKSSFGNAAGPASSNNALPDAASGTAAVPPSATQTSAPTIKIESAVDAETWAEYGGWYRQDHAIYYRPTGHKDKFLYAWLFLTGPQAKQDHSSPLGAVFQSLTGKDAQGACTKCHSIDGLTSGGRVVNFSPVSAANERGSFTRFNHEPHFNIMGEQGCLSCHKLEGQSPYLKSYEQGDPLHAVSNFGAVKKELCQGCHTQSKARQDCMTCHKYHVNGVTAPTTSTRTPDQ